MQVGVDGIDALERSEASALVEERGLPCFIFADEGCVDHRKESPGDAVGPVT